MSTALPAVPDPERPSPLAAVRRLDWWLLGTVVLFLGYGLLMILSATSLVADQRYTDPFHYILRQGAGVVGGLTLATAVVLTPWTWLRRAAWPAYLAGLVGLMLVFTPLGHTAYAATRWISLGGIHLQPSEFAKLGLILVMAHYLAANEGRLSDLLGVVVPALAIVLPMIVLLMLEPDFGTTVVTSVLVFLMLVIAGLHWGWVTTLGVLGGVLLSVGAVIAPYRVERLTSFLDPMSYPDTSGYQVIQGWIAMASGGWYGQGLASGVAQRGNLPEAHTDFISAVVGEELGAVGWIVLVGLYLVFVWRGFGIAARSRTLFGTLVAAAVTTLLASQAVINLGVVVGWMPAKGLVLPFMSYGASAVVAHLLAVGLLLRVSMETAPAGEADDPLPDPSEVLS
jgi:cell division protein FtsW